MSSTASGRSRISSDIENGGHGENGASYQPPTVQTSPPGADDCLSVFSDPVGNNDRYENLTETSQPKTSPETAKQSSASGRSSGEKSEERTSQVLDADASSREAGRDSVVIDSPHRSWRTSTQGQLDSPDTMKSADTDYTGGGGGMSPDTKGTDTDYTYQTMEDERARSGGSKSRLKTPGSTSVISFDYTEDENYDGQSSAFDSFLHEDSDYYYVKQKFGYLSIGLSTTQLFILAVQMLLCGVAPFDVNPMVGPYPDVLSEWGGRNTYLIVERLQIWRLITPFALHAGVIHLLCNVAVQLETAAFFEREWGSIRWAALYLSGAFGCNVASSIISPDEISVASSGALMGLFGAKLAEVTTMSLFQTRRRRGDLGHSVRLEQLGGVLCAVAVVGLFTFIPYVDWAGHLGGLCGGFAAGVVLFARRLQSVFLKFIWGLTGVALVVFSCVYSLIYLFQNVQPDEELGDVCEYFRRLFAEGYECECLA